MIVHVQFPRQTSRKITKDEQRNQIRVFVIRDGALDGKLVLKTSFASIEKIILAPGYDLRCLSTKLTGVIGRAYYILIVRQTHYSCVCGGSKLFSSCVCSVLFC